MRRTPACTPGIFVTWPGEPQLTFLWSVWILAFYVIGRPVLEVRINSEDPARFREQIRKAKWIVVPGGNTFILLRELQKAGVMDDLAEAIRRVPFVGISAGSILTSLVITQAEVFGDEVVPGLRGWGGLNMWSGYVLPHWSRKKPGLVGRLEEFMLQNQGDGDVIYAVPNNGAVCVTGEAGIPLEVECIGPVEAVHV